ncbi:uncharacterized protein Dvir_GJ25581 [Drosophila virilis]|uniref:Uncharacterized protein n=2 Tax=Drosophila virilis TaxID=7244 RepID=A0A0Q9WK99_DROVI|nr:uncharacterized protein LOC26530351 isoform X2 [Drosophila virilis]XP_032289108.1 uncharacterized protein LOC116649757 isoform X2 [Drosophila virilis]KRF85276.1 uncharacterized protein Dvir_GJ25581 [Drosophila virilis]
MATNWGAKGTGQNSLDARADMQTDCSVQAEINNSEISNESNDEEPPEFVCTSDDANYSPPKKMRLRMEKRAVYDGAQANASNWKTHLGI